MNLKSLSLASVGMWLGPLAFLLMMLANSPSYTTDQWHVLAVAVFMLIWWVTEAVPIAVTAMLPIILFPFLGVMPVGDATAPYGSHIVFLFLGGFLLALALERWELHRRIALNIVRLTGTKANRVILGFMLASAALSMWISNTATTVMMLPIAMSVIKLLHENESKHSGKALKNFDLALLLGVAYGANAGGVGTLIGTPPNLVFAGYFKDALGIDVSFFDWMKIGLPFSILLIFTTYLVLVHLLFPNRIGKFEAVETMISNELKSMGNLGREERRVLWIFVLTAASWISRSYLNELMPNFALNDTGIAIAAGVLLFVVPQKKFGSAALLDWDDTRRLPWGILLLFGGGLCLAGAFKDVGLIKMIGDAVVSMDLGSRLMLMLALTFIALFLTEVMSNVALTTVFVPVVAAIAMGIGLNPEYFAIPVTIAASCAYMLPMSTPPNAIVFASGKIKMIEMARAGIILNFMVIIMVSLLGYFVLENFKL